MSDIKSEIVKMLQKIEREVSLKYLVINGPNTPPAWWCLVNSGLYRID